MNSKQFAWAYMVDRGDANVKPSYYGGNDCEGETAKCLEQFAELIIQTCIDIISPYSLNMNNHDSGHPITDIKKHFGIEQ